MEEKKCKAGGVSNEPILTTIMTRIVVSRNNSQSIDDVASAAGI